MKKDVCIVVSFRDREKHLEKFVPYMNAFLTEENLSYEILVVEQNFDKPFNRAKLLNVGFDWAKGKFKNYVFHDVDMLPIKKKASYAVAETPTHYAAIVEQFGWQLAYPSYSGGVISFDEESFVKINGYCNEYWGWGAEDDDLFRRCTSHGIEIKRRDNMYSSLDHDRIILQDQYEKNLKVLSDWEKYKEDGLNDLKYDIVEQTTAYLYTRIKVII